MEWSDLGKQIANVAPMLGKLLPIPGAGIAGDLIASAFGTKNDTKSIASAIKIDPDAAIKLRKIELDNQALLQQQLLAAETSRILAVNQTMQIESKSEHWAQWLWRPFNGFSFGLTLFCNYGLVAIINTLAPIFAEHWTPVVSSVIPFEVFAAWGSLLGVSAWHRGAEKRAKVGDLGFVSNIIGAVKRGP